MVYVVKTWVCLLQAVLLGRHIVGTQWTWFWLPPASLGITAALFGDTGILEVSSEGDLVRDVDSLVSWALLNPCTPCPHGSHELWLREG